MSNEDLIATLIDTAEVEGPGTMGCLLNEAAETIENLEERVAIMSAEPDMQWISVKDRLPGKDGMYLCLTMFKNTFNYQITLWGGKHWFWGYDVCYWMPLPEPPKEGEVG